LKKKLSTTKKYLSVNSIILENGIPKIQRIDSDSEDGTVIVYFPIKEKEYFFAIKLKPEPDYEVKWSTMEAGNAVFLVVVSEKYNLNELKKIISFNPTEYWNKGEKIPFSNMPAKNTFLSFDPVNERADQFQDNLHKLLEHLEPHKESIITLSKTTNTFIQVHWYGYVGSISPINLNNNLVNKISSFNLSIEFDINVSGDVSLVQKQMFLKSFKLQATSCEVHG
jgi:hypothetical protein